MRKLFLSLFVACACVCAKAQAESPVLEDGNYVFKYVQQADGVSQSMLYLRAHTFLSDWVGPNSNSRTSIDFDDKETATIIVKGSYFLGYQKEVMYGWNVFADFIVNIKCKDNRFQVITKVPTMSFWWTAGNVALQTIPYNKLYPTYTHKGPYKMKKYSDRYVNQMPEYVKEISNMIVTGIMAVSDNDDF
jgi:hypothetical protein